MGKKEVHQRLRRGALNLGESAIMGVAGTAPAYSIAATTALLIAAVGMQAVATIFYCGLAMFGITLAYMHLNRVNADAGAAYAWVRDIFHPVLGFFAGWSLLISTAIFMVSGTIPAATATLALVAPDRVGDISWVLAIAAGWLLFVALIVIKGIKVTSYVQVVLTLIEVGIIAFITIAALYYFWGISPVTFDLKTFSLFSFSPHSFATGAVIAIFFFWGWDVTLNLCEETKSSAYIPGVGAGISMAIVLLLFMAFAYVVPMALSAAEIEASGTNLILALAEKLFSRPWSYMAVIAVVLSSVGTLETSILQFTRTMYAKGRDGVLPSHVALLHTRWKTPWVATLIVSGFGFVLIALASIYPTVMSIMKISVDSIGLQIAFYYSLTGYACAWYFRHTPLSAWKDFIIYVVWPFLSALFLTFIGCYSLFIFDRMTILLGLGGIIIGVIPLLGNRWLRK